MHEWINEWMNDIVFFLWIKFMEEIINIVNEVLIAI